VFAANECDYVKREYYLTDINEVKECFDFAEVPRSFVDAIFHSLDIIGDYYPYVDIFLNPPSDYFDTVNFTKELEDVKTLINSYDTYKLKDVVRPIQKFIDMFHDGHFALKFFESKTENPFATVDAKFPFKWDVFNVDDSNAEVYLSLSSSSSDFLDEQTSELIVSMKDVAVDTVDDIPAFKYFSEFYGVYHKLRSRQGSLQYTKKSSVEGFGVLIHPLDDDVLFGEHVVKYKDQSATNFSFHLGFVNKKNAKLARDFDAESASSSSSSFFSVVTLAQEERFIRALQSYNRNTMKRRNIRDHKYVKCGHENGMNHISIGTFNPEDGEDTMFIDELISCGELFDKNDDPITILLSMNSGGSVLLEQLTEIILTPNTEYRLLCATRKTEAAKKIMIDGKFSRIYGNLDNNCEALDTREEMEKMWQPTVIDNLGNGIKHVRTEKYFMTFKRYYQNYSSFIMKNPRKPTDIIIASDGFCFSACSVFVFNNMRKGSAIVTGFGPTNPGDTLFVAAQSPSPVVSPDEYFDTQANNSYHGLIIQGTFVESYNISYNKTISEELVIPGEFDFLRIDKHLDYNDTFSPSITDMIPYLKAVHKEFQTSCNPVNKRLFFVDSNCTLTDPNALSAGYACGSNGEWDKSECKISTCKIGYVVDFENNKCVPSSCDVRPTKSTSSSSSQSPPSPTPSPAPKPSSSHVSGASTIYPFIMTLLSVMVFFTL